MYVWSKEVYELEVKKVPRVVALDVAQLQGAVKTKQISGGQATQLFEGKYGTGASSKLSSTIGSLHTIFSPHYFKEECASLLPL